MKIHPRSKITSSQARATLSALTFFLIGTAAASAQCTEIVSGLRNPLATALTNQGNLLVSETGTPDKPRSGRISLVAPNGHRRTLLRGLPSGKSDVGDPSGPSGIFMRGRTLYLAMGVGDVGIAGPFPGATLENPNGPSSPIFSSILGIHLSAETEKTTTGFTLTRADEDALAKGKAVTLSDNHHNQLVIRLVVDFPNFVSAPLPTVPNNIAVSNPYHLAAVDGLEDMLYVTDGGRNLAWQVDLGTRSFSPLVQFPNVPNPFFPGLGGPFLQAVPTGIAAFGDSLFVTLLRGAPFPTGASSLEKINPTTGADTAFITGLTDAIDVHPIRSGKNYLVLQFASAGPFFQGPGLLLRFNDPAGPPTVLADCLVNPTSMSYNTETDTIYVSELSGSVVTIPFR